MADSRNTQNMKSQKSISFKRSAQTIFRRLQGYFHGKRSLTPATMNWAIQTIIQQMQQPHYRRRSIYWI